MDGSWSCLALFKDLDCRLVVETVKNNQCAFGRIVDLLALIWRQPVSVSIERVEPLVRLDDDADVHFGPLQRFLNMAIFPRIRREVQRELWLVLPDDFGPNPLDTARIGIR